VTGPAGGVGGLASVLAAAQDRRQAVPPLTDASPGLTLAEGYEIQAEGLRRRLGRGERVVGAKLGLTSRAKQQQMNVTQPIHGWLTDAMLLPADVALPADELIHPRVEPEIVFVLGEDLAGPGVSASDVLAATREIRGGLEIIDSRYADFRFTLPDVVADNASAARFTVGTGAIAAEGDLALLGCLLEVDGELLASAAGAAVLGSPAEAVAQLVNAVGRLQRGWVVLSGALTEAAPLPPGSHAVASFGRGLGRVGVRACR
jgi:2-oxo-3-hexenedioate decarboxylase